MNFWKTPEGGIISDPKNFIAFFFALETVILVMNFRKNFKKGGGGHFRSEKFICKFSAGATSLRKNRNIIFRKRGGGGAKGRSEIFRKFIHFGRDRHPLVYDFFFFFFSKINNKLIICIACDP